MCTTPLARSRATIGSKEATAIGDWNGVWTVVTLRSRWIFCAAGDDDGNAKAYFPRSTVVAICRDPAVSTSTFRPCRAKASTTRRSVKKACFSEPITPRTVVVEPAALSSPRPQMITPTTASTSTTASPIDTRRFTSTPLSRLRPLDAGASRFEVNGG